MRHKFKRVPVYEAERIANFHELLRRFRKAAHRFDEGDNDAAADIVGLLRPLLNRKRGDDQLNWFAEHHRRQLKMLSTPDQGVLGCRLVRLTGQAWSGKAGQGQILYLPVYEPARHRGFQWQELEYAKWWDDEPVVRMSSGGVLTRRDLVTVMANQDGVIHQDDSIDERYADVKRQKFLKATLLLGTATPKAFSPKQGIENASIRQIAYEVQCTLQSGFCDLLDEDIWFPPPPRPRLPEPGVEITYDPGYPALLQSNLDELRRKGLGDSREAKVLETALYWKDYSLNDLL
jgi:hypothetical protein